MDVGSCVGGEDGEHNGFGFVNTSKVVATQGAFFLGKESLACSTKQKTSFSTAKSEVFSCGTDFSVIALIESQHQNVIFNCSAYVILQ